MTKEPRLTVDLLLCQVTVIREKFTKLSWTVAPSHFHPRILLSSLVAQYPGNLLLGRGVMRGHSIAVECEPTVSWSSASSEDMEIVKRRTWPLTSHSLKPEVQCMPSSTQLTYSVSTLDKTNRDSHSAGECLPSPHWPRSWRRWESFVLWRLCLCKSLSGSILSCEVFKDPCSVITCSINPGRCLIYLVAQPKEWGWAGARATTGSFGPPEAAPKDILAHQESFRQYSNVLCAPTTDPSLASVRRDALLASSKGSRITANPLRGVVCFFFFFWSRISGHKMEYGLQVSWEEVLGSDSLKGGLEISGPQAHLPRAQVTQW